MKKNGQGHGLDYRWRPAASLLVRVLEISADPSCGREMQQPRVSKTMNLQNVNVSLVRIKCASISLGYYGRNPAEFH
jgi:hypothetical protein